MSATFHIILRKSKVFQRIHQKISRLLDITHKIRITSRVLNKEVARLKMLIPIQPVIKDFKHLIGFVQLRVQLISKIDLIDVDVYDVLEDLFLVFDAVLLDVHSLGVDPA